MLLLAPPPTLAADSPWLTQPEAAFGDRRSPLRRRTPLTGKPLGGTASTRRTPPRLQPQTEPRRRVRANTGPTPATRALVLSRDQHQCIACALTVLTDWPGYSLQHRVARGAGGRTGPIADYLNSPANLITLCGSGTTGCHGWAEAHPATATTFGLSVPSWADPATVPVRGRYGWVLYAADGTSRALERGPVAALDHPGVRRLEVA